MKPLRIIGSTIGGALFFAALLLFVTALDSLIN
jgi:hypothetical protein